MTAHYTKRLKTEDVGVVLVDYLDGFLPGIRSIDARVFRKNAEAFARISAIFRLPTIMLGEEGGFRGKFFAEVIAAAPHAQRVERHTPSAWDEPNFRAAVEKIGRKRWIVGGISLDICTTLLTLDMLNAGHEVFVVVDACGSDSQLVEAAAMSRLTQAGATLVSWGTIASELMGDWQTPEGPEVGKLYAELSAWGNRV
jgi:hypothetical protein